MSICIWHRFAWHDLFTGICAAITFYAVQLPLYVCGVSHGACMMSKCVAPIAAQTGVIHPLSEHCNKCLESITQKQVQSDIATVRQPAIKSYPSRGSWQ